VNALAENHARRDRRRGFSLVEALMCTLLVSVLFVVAVQAVGMSGTIQFKAADRARGRALAMALLEEVVAQRYSSSSPPGSFEWILGSSGSSGGSGGADRLGFDDVDDYRNYADAPPVNRDGTAIAGAGAYARRVDVAYVSPTDPTQTSVTDRGLKRITVRVTRGGQTVARASAVRADVP
jgi:type II secretory pathway pseudopilin PulG